MGISFTLDLEDHRADRTSPPRYPAVVEEVLDFLDGRGIRGTFFVVGEVVEEHPRLVVEVAARGHEIGFHGQRHLPLRLESRERFRRDTLEGKRRLEDLLGTAVRGFRAPVFSLVEETLWALEVLAEAEFGYSSSVLPAANPLYGFPAAPHGPFLWPGGVLEIPVPVARFLGLTVPYLGGIYLRYLPLPWIMRQGRGDPGRWCYIHPYDFDATEPFARVRDATLATSLLLWFRRRTTYRRLSRLFSEGAAAPLGERIAAGEFRQAPYFDPRGEGP